MRTDIARGAPAGRYVLTTKIGRRPIDPIRRVTSRAILERHYPGLPAAAREEFDQLRAAETADGGRLASWAWRFVDAYTDGRDSLPCRAGGVISRFDRSGWSTAELALAAVIDAGEEGISAHQVNVALDLRTDGTSGSLVQLAQAGVVARLARLRPADDRPDPLGGECGEDLT